MIVQFDLKPIVLRSAYAVAVLWALSCLLPQLALSFVPDESRWLFEYTYYWPQRAFPTGFWFSNGDYLIERYGSSAFVLAIDFWVLFSLAVIYLTRRIKFRLFALTYIGSVFFVEALWSILMSVCVWNVWLSPMP